MKKYGIISQKSFRSYLINHHSHQDMFIDNPALQQTRDWIFDLKKGNCTWPDRKCTEVDVFVYCSLFLRPEKLTKDVIYLLLGRRCFFSMKNYYIEIYGECYQKYIQGNHCYKRN